MRISKRLLMTILRDEYLLRRAERARVQWGTKAEEAGKLLKQAGKLLTAPRERMTLDEIGRI